MTRERDRLLKLQQRRLLVRFGALVALVAANALLHVAPWWAPFAAWDVFVLGESRGWRQGWRDRGEHVGRVDRRAVEHALAEHAARQMEAARWN